MNITNEIVDDYMKYCHQKLIEEFGKYEYEKYDPMYWYERYKCRIIDRRKRIIMEADNLMIPKKYKNIYRIIVSDILNGSNLKKYQSRKLKNLDYDDDMLSHWGVQHLHLSNVIENDSYVSRTKDLLFIYFAQHKAYILGIFNHNSWCDLDIIEKIHKNWPEELAFLKLAGESNILTEEEHKFFRKKHVNTIIRVKDGTEYFAPGKGVTSNGASMLAVCNSMQKIYTFNQAFEIIKENIQLILDLDPEKRESKNITIGMEIDKETNKTVYKVKETGFKFHNVAEKSFYNSFESS